MSPLKKAFVKSYGCQMNVYDSARIGDLLAAEGYTDTNSAEDADVIVLNTCHIREKAAEKVYSELGRLRELKDERAAAGRPTTIVVAGCVAQAEGAEIHRRQRAVDAVVGPQSYGDLPAILRRAAERPGVVETEFPADSKFAHLPRSPASRIRARGVSAFLTVQEGCDKFCSFCVVPYTRGAELSRPVAEIADEARGLIEAGVREITLIGQNVNAYHGEAADGREWGLARLAAHLGETLGHRGLARLRYTTSHPLDMDDELIAAHRELPVLMPFLHLPVQAGSDRVLAAMNRRHTADDYRRLVDRIRAARPDVALSSDFIVGFPGETDAEFDETLRLAAEIGFASSFSFKYSPRPGTSAADAAAQVDEAVKSERLARLQERLEADRQRFNASCVGRTFDVLIEKAGRHPGQLGGKSPYLQAVHVEGASGSIGDLVPVTITARGPNSLAAVPAATPAALLPMAAA